MDKEGFWGFGAIVAGPTIDNFQIVDSPNDAPKTIIEGLGLTNIVVIPHFGNDKYGHVMESISIAFKSSKVKSINLSDNQAIIINGDKISVVE